MPQRKPSVGDTRGRILRQSVPPLLIEDRQRAAAEALSRLPAMIQVSRMTAAQLRSPKSRATQRILLQINELLSPSTTRREDPELTADIGHVIPFETRIRGGELQKRTNRGYVIQVVVVVGQRRAG